MKTREYIVLQDEDGFLHFVDEIIRCKDCKYSVQCMKVAYINDETDIISNPIYYCAFRDVWQDTKKDNFCSYGKWREKWQEN